MQVYCLQTSQFLFIDIGKSTDNRDRSRLLCILVLAFRFILAFGKLKARYSVKIKYWELPTLVRSYEMQHTDPYVFLNTLRILVINDHWVLKSEICKNLRVPRIDIVINLTSREEGREEGLANGGPWATMAHLRKLIQYILYMRSCHDKKSKWGICTTFYSEEDHSTNINFI